MARSSIAAFSLAGVCMLALTIGSDLAMRPPQSISPPPTSGAVPRPPLPTFQLRVREGSSLPRGCTPRIAADVFLGFVAAFNRGDFKAAVEFFPAEATGDYSIPPEMDQFGWFAVTGAVNSFNPGFGALNREELLPYLAERHALNERWYLLQMDVAGTGDGGFGSVFDLHRQADDIPTHVAGGKGGGDCLGGTISVWNLGDREGLPDFINPPPVPTCPPDRPNCE